jgi:hypothetical protein
MVVVAQASTTQFEYNRLAAQRAAPSQGSPTGDKHEPDANVIGIHTVQNCPRHTQFPFAFRCVEVIENALHTWAGAMKHALAGSLEWMPQQVHVDTCFIGAVPYPVSSDSTGFDDGGIDGTHPDSKLADQAPKPDINLGQLRRT